MYLQSMPLSVACQQCRQCCPPSLVRLDESNVALLAGQTNTHVRLVPQNSHDIEAFDSRGQGQIRICNHYQVHCYRALFYHASLTSQLMNNRYDPRSPLNHFSVSFTLSTDIFISFYPYYFCVCRAPETTAQSFLATRGPSTRLPYFGTIPILPSNWWA